MALKSKLTKAEFDALPKELQEHYKQESGKDTYLLESDGADELRRAKEREEQARKDAETLATKEKERADELQRKLDDESTASARKRGDIEKIEASWKQKVEAAETAGKTAVEKLRGFITKTLGDNVALTLAQQISTKPNLILPHIKSRIAVDFDGDEPKTRVLDAAGKPTALTPEDLSKEFVANADFADIIIGSKGSGSGASGQQGGGASKKLADMNDAERTAWYQKDPAGFNAAVAAEKTAASAGT